VDAVSTRSNYRALEESITLSPLEEQIAAQRGGETTELLTLNIGPHHPATHGVLRLLVTLEGEVVRELKRSSATSTPGSRRPPSRRPTGR
jgi:NADH-quinone oxidoreductase subunit D